MSLWMAARDSGVKTSPGFASLRAAWISFASARWFVSICCGVASFGRWGSVASSFLWSAT